jgi:hypothetical protein
MTAVTVTVTAVRWRNQDVKQGTDGCDSIDWIRQTTKAPIWQTGRQPSPAFPEKEDVFR